MADDPENHTLALLREMRAEMREPNSRKWTQTRRPRRLRS